MLPVNYALGIARLRAGRAGVGAVGGARRALQLVGDCGTENLLAGRMPVGRQDIRGDLRLPTDGQVAPEGAQWDAPVGVFFDTRRRLADLGPRRGPSGLVVPAPGRRQRHLQDLRRRDGHARRPTSCWSRSRASSTSATGCARAPSPSTRRRSASCGSASRSATAPTRSSEFQAYCRAPNPFPPKLPIVDAPRGEGRRGALVAVLLVRERRQRALRDGAWRCSAMALLGWGLWLDQAGAPEGAPRCCAIAC